MATQPVNLVSIAGGAAVEKFEHELARVLANIADVNTEAEAVREIVLRVKFKPTSNREQEMVAVAVLSDAKLAPLKAHAAGIYLVRDKEGDWGAIDADPRQGRLYDEPAQTTDKPTILKGGKD